MSRTREESRSVVVELEDEYGTHVKRVFVEVPVVTVSYVHGEDADGRRGEIREEIIPNIAEAHIPCRQFLGLTSAQLEAVLQMAEETIIRYG